jgi:hypothetical protein
MIQEDFNKLSKEFEETLQRLATDIATGVLFERLPPMDLWKMSEASVTRLKDLAESCKELMLILKPENAVTIEQRFSVVSQSLTNFRDILFQNSAEPLANSRLAFEQLRRAVVDGSDFLMLIREVRANPSPAIGEILRLREALETKGTVVTIEAPESIQPMLERLMRDIETLRSSLATLERAFQDVKDRVRVLQDDSLRFTSSKPSASAAEVAKDDSVKEEKPPQQVSQKGQLSLSQFKN